jgi:HAMP domain-containing protein
MFKSLCVRAIVPVVLAVTGFVVLCCILLYTIIKTDLTTHEAEKSASLAGTVLKSARYAMLRDDRETLSNIMHNIGEQPGVEHTRIFNKEGRVMFSGLDEELKHTVDSKAEGCAGCHSGPVPLSQPELAQMTRRFINSRGFEVLAVTAPIYNEPECSATACHPSPEQQKVLGMLDIGLDQAPLHKALNTLKARMTLFSLMVLVLTVGGVAALLNRQVFVPIRRLSDFTDRVVDGSLDEEFCDGCIEVETVARNVRRLAADLEAAKAQVRHLHQAVGAGSAGAVIGKGAENEVFGEGGTRGADGRSPGAQSGR